MKFKGLYAAAASLAVLLPLASCSEEPLPEAELPIMAWHSIPASHTSVETFQEMKDCGFNIHFTFYYSLKDLFNALDAAEKVGVKVMASASALYSQTDSVVNLIKDNPALYGYFLRDEPLPPAFPDLAAWAQRIKDADKGEHPLYLNLFPSYVDFSGFGMTYRDYVRQFIDEVKLPMVSFDNYPLTIEDGIRQLWYSNLQIVMEESEKSGLPFWAFALCVPHWNYPVPTMASLRIQQYTNLAYGASGLQYFTYWTPNPEDPFHYHDAPITWEGEKTFQYDNVKTLNAELQARAGVFVGSKVVSLAHTGTVLPPDSPALVDMPAHVKSLSTGGDGAVVSLLENGEWNYLVVVSRTVDKPVTLDVEFDEKACMVDREGKLQKVAKGKNSFTIEEGDVAIFRFKK
ncbi:MAG: hypothetical protein MJY84_03790 [Bacteroidales bacterium]|nr:hypothetical protein [Bacteroidales bacterium]